MEGAGKLVEDEELREAMSAKGLGTPATRASTIEGLIFENYMQRVGRDLHPTAKAFSLITLLRGLKIPELTSPELTGNWEFKLRQIEQNQLERNTFMKEISSMTRHMVEQAKSHRGETITGNFSKLKLPCPKCNGLIQETYKKFQCQECDFFFGKFWQDDNLKLPRLKNLLPRMKLVHCKVFVARWGDSLMLILNSPISSR